MKRTFLRIVSAFLAVVMMVGANMTAIFAVDAPDGAKVENNVINTTDAQIVADNYDFLSSAEKAVLTCTALVGNSHTVTAPTDANKDELIVINKDSKTVTVKPFVKDGYTWEPVSAKVKYKNALGQEQTPYPVVLTASADVYTGEFTAINADSYTIDVDYAVSVEIPVDEQKELANAPAYLANGIVNLDMILNSVDAKLNLLTQNIDGSVALDELYKLVTGIPATIPVPNGSPLTIYVKFTEGSDEYNATVDLKKDRDDNGGVFGINVLINEYKKSDNKVAFLIDKGDEVKAAFDRVYNNIAVLSRDGSALVVLSNQVDGYVTNGWIPQSTANTLKTGIDVLDNINDAMAAVPAANWEVLKHDLIKTGATDAEMAALDAAVKALASNGTIALNDAETYTASLKVASTTVTQGVDQYKVTVVVKANVIAGVDSDKVTTLTFAESISPVFDKDTTKAAIQSYIEADGIIDRALAAWTANDASKGYEIGKTYYNVVYKGLSDTLSGVATCEVVFVPKTYTVTLGYGAAMTVPYGYKYTLPTYASVNAGDNSKSYDYTVGGKAMREGVAYTVVGDVAITRVEGKATEKVSIAKVVSNIVASEKGKIILNASAIKSDDLYFRTPDDSSALLTISAVSGTEYAVTAAKLASGLTSLAEWAPAYGYAADIAGKEIAGTRFTFDVNGNGTLKASGFNDVKVVYKLTVADSDVDKDTVTLYANLPYNLVNEAKAQKDLLSPLTSGSVYDNLSMVNGFAGTLAAFEALGFGTEAVAAANYLTANCVYTNEADSTKGFYLVKYIEEYNEKGLVWLYTGTNAVLMADQIKAVASNLEPIIMDPAFKGLLDSVGKGDKLDTIKSMIGELNDVVAKIDAGVLNVNPMINTNSGDLAISQLVSAIEATGTVEEVVVSNLTLETVLSIVAPGIVKVIVNIVAKDGNGNDIYGSAASQNTTFAINSVLSADDIANIEKMITALNNNVKLADGVDKAFYNCAVDGRLTEGHTLAGDATISIVWSPKNYTVKIDGEADQKITADNRVITLPACTDAKYKYVYSIGSSEKIEVSTEAKTRTFTFAELNSLFVDGTLTITRVSVEVARDNLIKFVNDMNAAFDAAALPVSFVLAENGAGEFAVVLRVSANIAGMNTSGMMSLASALNSCSYIGLGGNAFYSNAIVSVQAAVDMIAESDFGFDTLCAAIDANGKVVNMTLPGYDVFGGSGELGGKLLESTFELNSPDLSYPLYVTLAGGDASTLSAIRDALNSVRSYVDLKCADGRFNITVNAPNSVYPYYLAEMLFLDKTDLGNVNGMDLGECIEYEVSLIKPVITDPQFSIETIENTLAKLGKTMDLSKYESAFKTVVKFANYLFDNATVEASSNGSTYSGTASCNIRNGLLSFDLPEVVTALIAEASETSKGISVDFAITLNNMDVTYDALIVDYSAAGIKNKVYCTTDLASVLEKLNNNAVVVLLSDVTLGKAVTISNNVFINLNGFDLVGDITSNASVRIVDSKIATEDAGTVDGKLSGSFVITAGKYTSDISAMLRKGYSVNANGYVCNDLYSLKQNGDNIEIILSADVLNANIPDVKAFLMDVVVDIALNIYTSAAVSVDGNSIYKAELNDVVGMLENTKVDLANTVIDIIDLDGVNYIVDSLIADICGDLGALATAIRGGSAVAEYAYEAYGWDIETAVAAGNYVTVNLVPNDNVTSGNIVVKIGAEGEDTTALADLFDNLNKIVKIENIDFNINDVEYLGGTDVNVDYDATANATLDLSANNDYAALVAAAVAYKLPAGAQKTAMVEALNKYFTTSATDALLEALEGATAAQVIAAVKALGSVECADMLAALGLTSASVVELEAVYADLIDVAAAVLIKLDITGNAATIKGIKVADSYATYNLAKENVKGYNVDIDLTLVLMSKVESEIVIELVEPDLTDSKVNDLVRGFKYVAADNMAFVDAIPAGVTVDQLLSIVNFQISNASAQNIYVVDANGNPCAKDALVCNGYSVVVEASNAGDSDKVTIQIIIVGDTNGNGKVDSQDATLMSNHYLGYVTLSDVALKASDVNNNGKLDSYDATFNCSKYWTWDVDKYESYYNN